MTDRELLELAAKAAGIHVEEWIEVGVHSGFTVDHGIRPNGICWNPLTDDGDALRLAVKLKLQVTPGTYKNHETTAFHAGLGEAHEHVHYQQDIYAATRRAIVRAAAEIGKAMQ